MSLVTGTKLGRDVAIKILPDAFAEDWERLQRFEREARVLAQLNHANVAALYGLEEIDGRQLLVMEFVQGETLAEQIARGAIDVEEAIPLFIQIARGLEAAHNKGIVQRDLKPATIKITPDGSVKILDFGLAKAFAVDEDATAETSQSPTRHSNDFFASLRLRRGCAPDRVLPEAYRSFRPHRFSESRRSRGPGGRAGV